MKPEETIDYPIRRAWHSIARMYNNEAAKHDGSMSLGYVLLNIDIENGTPSTKLGPQMGMESRSLTRTLKSMEEKGLIYRKSDKKDKRLVHILLTESGIEKREISKNAVIKFNETIQAQIAPKKLQHFFEVMEEINGVLDNKEVF